mmetsp:Transcript_8025/g.20627  ORF Transcript_8025/g.20627 Transcript_8025/m.20627 type:complete len:81 (-) Transcript_8025:607-849(-)
MLRASCRAVTLMMRCVCVCLCLSVEVVIGVVDPNPLVGGAGIKTLEAAGIEAELIGGEEETRCYQMNEEFMENMKNSAKH